MSIILTIDDETQIRKFLKIALESHGFTVVQAENGHEGITMAATHRPDAIVLDLGLPDINGQEVLKSLREWYHKPILILSVRNDEENIVTALDAGANDYLRKPFSLAELLARLRVCMRASQENQSDPQLKFGELAIDVPTHKLTIAGREVKLTSTEFALLKLLALNEGNVVTHSHILREIWGPNADKNVQYLRVYIGHLRQKIEKDSNRPQWIVTEPGVGYRFNGPQQV